MKKIKLIYLCLLGISLSFISCNNDQDKNDGRFDDSDPTSGWVQFADNSTIYVLYGSETSTVSAPVVLKAPVNASGVEVSYTVTDVEGNSTDIVPVRSGTLEISKNGLTKNINLDIDTNVGLPATAEFDITLTTTNKSNVQVGLSDGSKPVTKRVKIIRIKTDAPYYNGTVKISDTPSIEGESGIEGPDFIEILNPVEGNINQFTTVSAWGTDFVPFLTGSAANVRDYPAIITVSGVLNGDGLFPVTVEGTGNVTLYKGGTGTYDPATDTFSLNLQQAVFNGNPTFSVDVVYTPIVE